MYYDEYDGLAAGNVLPPLHGVSSILPMHQLLDRVSLVTSVALELSVQAALRVMIFFPLLGFNSAGFWMLIGVGLVGH